MNHHNDRRGELAADFLSVQPTSTCVSGRDCSACRARENLHLTQTLRHVVVVAAADQHQTMIQQRQTVHVDVARELEVSSSVERWLADC